ncbi:hypothetical protein L7F22_021577 [Adiantum nelumboides]|nr:hypothetical protein [Adiantum nelumboides]
MSGAYCFCVHGSLYHQVGSLVPHDSGPPKFAQMYVYDTDHEVQNRMNALEGLDVSILQALSIMMQSLFGTCCNEIAGIMPGQGDLRTSGQRDIVLHCQDGRLQRISNLHRSYMPLLYVLLFPRGEDGWHLKLPYADMDVPTNALTDHQCVTQREYYAYRLQVWPDTNACLLCGGRLLQQFIIDAYCTIEDCRLSWIRNHQHTLRAELYVGLIDRAHSNEGDVLGQSVGQRIVLPSSFTGGPRHMYQLYQDAMAIVRAKGKPDLFITSTCNPNWPEVTQALLPGQVSADRPNITARDFFQKHSSLMKHVLKENLFGKVVGYMSVVEFQKRGLAHSHTLLILDTTCKPQTTSDSDKMVCAELPDKGRFPMLHDTIVTCNIHGPCKEFNDLAPCMANGQCTKRYPRPFCEHTTVDTRGYPVDRWQDNGSTARAVKYVYKYIYKGHDRATVRFHAAQDAGQRQHHVDEIDIYLDGRYVSASEACWRIFEFPLNSDAPDVQRLSVHVPSGQMVTFQDHDRLGDVLQRDTLEKTTSTEWFVCNVENPEANDTLYIDFPQKWVWNSSSKKWTKRRRGDTIGRMYFVQPSAGERYYVRLLLTICKKCKSFKDLQIVNGVVFPTFKAACIARRVLEDDDEWSSCIEEACMTHTANIAYCKWLMDIGNGTLTSHEDHMMAISSDMVLSNQSMDGLTCYVYSDMNTHLGDASYFKDRAILAPRNCEVDIVNAKTLCAMSGDIVEYFSVDSIIEDSVQQSFLYSMEFLNGLNLGGGFPVHYLQLKLNAPIILLRNLDPSRGLCNGTRLVCKAFHQRVLEAEIVTGTCVGTRVFIPRICFIYSGAQLPFVVRRRQFPVRLAFGMTINKSQGQSIAHFGL